MVKYKSNTDKVHLYGCISCDILFDCACLLTLRHKQIILNNSVMMLAVVTSVRKDSCTNIVYVCHHETSVGFI